MIENYENEKNQEGEQEEEEGSQLMEIEDLDNSEMNQSSLKTNKMRKLDILVRALSKFQQLNKDKSTSNESTSSSLFPINGSIPDMHCSSGFYQISSHLFLSSFFYLSFHFFF